MPKLSPPSADAATAADKDARSRLLLLAQAGHIYECLVQYYGYFRQATLTPNLCCSRSRAWFGWGFGGLGEPIIVNDRFATQFIQIKDRYPRIYCARFVRNAK